MAPDAPHVSGLPTDTPAATLDNPTSNTDPPPLLVHQTLDADNKARIAAIMSALASGTPYREICAQFRVSSVTISAIAKGMREFDPTTVSLVMASRTLEMLDRWQQAAETGAKQGKHAPAKEWLTHARVLAPVQSDEHTGAKVTVIIGSLDAPLRPDLSQVIDAQGVSVD